MAVVSLVSLNTVETGQVVEVAQILGGAGVICRLNSMGIEVGTKIKKNSSKLTNGPIIVEVKDTQIAIGRGIAEKIFVKI